MSIDSSTEWTKGYSAGFKAAIKSTGQGWADLHCAIRMIRDAVEEIGPVGCVQSRDDGPPDPIQEAEDIIAGIAKIAREAY